MINNDLWWINKKWINVMTISLSDKQTKSRNLVTVIEAIRWAKKINNITRPCVIGSQLSCTSAPNWRWMLSLKWLYRECAFFKGSCHRPLWCFQHRAAIPVPSTLLITTTENLARSDSWLRPALSQSLTTTRDHIVKQRQWRAGVSRMYWRYIMWNKQWHMLNHVC